MSNQKNKKDINFEAGELYQEKQSFQRYLRDDLKMQRQRFYVNLASAMILLGIFLFLISNGLR
jgi:hypothetical protein